ncbi:MAG: glycosyltransferase [Bacteroidales bacterium]|nr:glycosyltransferase [Bacteroidales bacterium]
MDLSVIIVNYNVKYFLEQCLHSVEKAMEGLSVEVFVVDNNSVDGSVNHIRPKFPWVRIIENKKNLGFSKANNQAIKESSGRYVLLLNPDTVVEEQTFRKCIAFMDAHPEAGALGVKMIDGKGHFLPESKRSLPTPAVAFCKVFGLSALFPKSKRFGKYHLGYLDKNQVHAVDVLAGAFMFLRKETISKVGLLDEDYFMYGEDIDLSYRFTKAGYQNYYFPETTIIHYKGESTKKSSVNYVIIFYRAMIIFARKHFSQRKAKIFSLLINLAIYIRAFLAIFRRFLKKIYRPFLDAILIFLGYFLLLPLWEQVKFGNANYYPSEFLTVVVPCYILIWLLSLYYSGGYDKPLNILNFLKGHIIGTLLILIGYALLPESWRFSRALILLGSLWAILITTGLRIINHYLGWRDYEIAVNKKKRLVIVGKEAEARRVSEVLQKTDIKPDIIGFVSPASKSHEPFIGSIDQIEDIVHINRVDEIVFCSRDIPSQNIIGIMTRLIGLSVDYKIAPPESLSVIGSNSINTAGDLYTIHFNSIGKESNRRNKRLFDFLSASAILLTFPIWFLVFRKPARGIKNALLVIFGKRTWVGYCLPDQSDSTSLPRLRPGILFPSDIQVQKLTNRELTARINILYAKDYKLTNDLLIFFRNIRNLGNV